MRGRSPFFRAAFLLTFGTFALFGTCPIRAVFAKRPSLLGGDGFVQRRPGAPGVPYKRRPSRMARVVPPAPAPAGASQQAALPHAAVSAPPLAPRRALSPGALVVSLAPARPAFSGRAPPVA